MKKFTKLFLSCTAVAAITAALAASAMAAEVDLKGSDGIVGIYNTETGVVSLSTLPNADDAIKTVLVLKPSEVSASDTGITVVAENIIGIDQTDKLTEVKLDASKVDTENNNYTVFVGGSSGKVYKATFGGKTAAASYGQVTLGDTDIDFEDAVLILKYELNKVTLTDEQKLNANIVDIEAGEIDFEDAVDILKYELDKPCELKKLLGEN